MGGHVVDERVAGHPMAGVEVVVTHYQIAHGAVGDGVHHTTVRRVLRAGPHAADRIAAICGHVDACPGATLAADWSEVDHAVVEDAVIRVRPIASDGTDLAWRDGV